jgi:drug/metabolite transporter (DMT)-like permease
MSAPPSAPSRRASSASGLLLFILPSFIWGTTWLVIKFQLGVVAPEASVAWRFALAAALLFGWCTLRGIPLRFGAGDHLHLALLGLLLFGLNYVLVYFAEGALTSGLVAVLFAFIVFWNLLGARVFFGTPAPRAVVAGALLGVIGVGLLFWPEVTSLRADAGQGLGVLYAALGTLVASAGNLWSQRLFARGVDVVPGTAWAMGYASLQVLAWCALRGVPLAFDPRPAYVLSLLYLAILGSVVAFVSYLTLLKRIGAGRAGYTAAVIPVVAMLASTLFEGYLWSGTAVAGLVLVLAGTVLVLRAKERGARGR